MGTPLGIELITSDFPNVEIVRVVDGDTFVVEINDVPDVFRYMSVRIKGVDTPELAGKKPCEKRLAKVAKVETERLLLEEGGPIQLLFCESDKYYRLACFVMKGELNVSEHLIAQGFGVPYSGDTARLAWKCKK